MLWHLSIQSAPQQPDIEGTKAAAEAAELGLPGPWRIKASRGFLLEGDLSPEEMGKAARTTLVDPVVETFTILPCPQPAAESTDSTSVHVLPKPGVTDPVAESALALLQDLGFPVQGVRTVRTYHVLGPASGLTRLVERVLSNSAVEQALVGPLTLDHLGQGHPYSFHLVTVPLRSMDEAELLRTSREGQLSLSIQEMRAVQDHFASLQRDPTDCELETIAQTWSEHCSHKTLKGLIDFEGRRIDNLLKQTVFKATQQLQLDWLVSVFADNAGVVRFDEEFDVCFKVETHNHPSAIDPYGGANTGIGGVIRDILGTGLAAKPICNTDIFCVAPPDTSPSSLPPGVIHPRRILEEIVAGVRDYGNRMGIPTVNGALVTDPRYLTNPLVFCGTIGLLPKGKAHKKPEPGDLIVAIGGRTGRDGIHGATFSSVELSSQSEEVSGGAVQIGNAITEKMVADVLLQARERSLFHSLTDCGAGGFSSAVGEMAADLGALVHLERAPLKYQGLSYTEIWISEAQERMVLAVPPDKWPELRHLCESEGVEATNLGEFTSTGRLTLKYQGQVVCDLDLDFLHEGGPRVVRRACYIAPLDRYEDLPDQSDFSDDVRAILHDWNVASKEWIIRQYDHEVQARTVIKPLVGPDDDGPGDAAVILPVPHSFRGLAVSCGINPRYGDIDPYSMAACAIDEAVRNCVAVGADPDRIALLDNFCWGSPERPETLGSLVLAAEACTDTAMALRTPFISGKDSLYNEYSHQGISHAIPGTLLISAFGQIPDVRQAVTMDFKEPGNHVLILGETRNELGGSLWFGLCGIEGGNPPRVLPEPARALFLKLHEAIRAGLVRSCHDLSEGGLAIALAEMAIAGGLGAEVSLRDLPCPDEDAHDPVLLFSESPSRFLLEVQPRHLSKLSDLFGDLPWGLLGQVAHPEDQTDRTARLAISGIQGSRLIVDATVASLKTAWKRPLHR